LLTIDLCITEGFIIYDVDIYLRGLVILLFGIVAGYLINYLGDVLPASRKLTNPICVKCGRNISLKEFIFNLRVYSECGDSRPIRSIVVLVASIGVAFWLGFEAPASISPWVGFILLVYFGVVTLIDIEHKLIMHPVSIFGMVLGLIIGWSRHGLLATLLGGLAGFALMFGLYLLGELFARWLRVRRGLDPEEVALGFGDVNLAAVIGLLLGWPGVIAGIILAILLGGAGSLIYMLWTWVRKDYHSLAAIPYGPFLILAAILLLFR
jgi:leader peptidase (prepilin peptidase)/N-methyltransferase